MLQTQIDGRGDARLAAARGTARRHQLLHRMRRLERQARQRPYGEGQIEQRLKRCIARMLRQPVLVKPVARSLEPRIEETLIAGLAAQAPFRILRQHRQGQGFGQGQRAHRPVEIGDGRGARAFDIVAVGRIVEIGLQNVVLGIEELKLDGARHLRRLAQRRTRIQRP